MKAETTRKRARKIDADTAGADAAMRRAVRRAHERAARFGHKIVIFEDGAIKEIDPIVGQAKTEKSNIKPVSTSTKKSGRTKRAAR